MGTADSQALAATGGQPPYTWSLVTGTLPPGLTLNATSGVISGTPTAVGNFGFTVQVSDSTGESFAQADLSIAVLGLTDNLTKHGSVL